MRLSAVGALGGLALLLASPRAGAQVAMVDASGVVSCEPISRELAASRAETVTAQAEAEACESKLATCSTSLSSSTKESRQQKDATKTCEDARAHLCSATATFVDELVRGRTHGASETGCVSNEQQTRLDAMVNGWSATTTWLNQLAAYQSGETDVIPRPRPGASPLDRAAQRMARNGGGRALHHRLLVEAIELIAPRAWATIRAAGSAAVDAWFTATTPLDADLINEAKLAEAAPVGPSGPPLTAALHLVRAFKVAARCDQGEIDECVRASQLERLLESSGALVVRRRLQEIWATECTTIAPETTRAWLQDFPTARGKSAVQSWREVEEAAYAKLFACYLDDTSAHTPFGSWLTEKLPDAAALDASRLERVDAIRAQWSDGSRAAACARAVRSMQTFTLPSECSVPSGDFRGALDGWKNVAGKLDDADVPLAMCAQYARLLWEGKAASIDGSFAHPPSVDDMVSAKPLPPTSMWRLREHCDERRGGRTFPDDVAVLAGFARAFGEGLEGPPFRLEPSTSKPIELVRFESVQGAGPWLSHLARGTNACDKLGLDADRCRVCTNTAPTAAYDCGLVDRLESTWLDRTRRLVGTLAFLLLAIAGATWLRRIVRARREYAEWSHEARIFFDGLGLSSRPDRWRAFLPTRYDTLTLTLPRDPAWERWGSSAVVVRVPHRSRVVEADVNHAAFVARRTEAPVVILEHDDNASLDLSAVRAILEWSAKGGAKAVQVLPIGISRARWSKDAHDVLDLVEESSLRGNPFEIRGRIATSSQFFNRERLVSGLLAAAQAGHWTVVTGLRRFGKSSLALEVARRIPGPSAYVDVAGFDHELLRDGEPATAACAILRFVCTRLAESARERWPTAELPDPPSEDAALDAAGLTRWVRDFSRACRRASGRTSTILIVLDELEQALNVGPSRLAHVLDVLAIAIGRLKSAVGDAALPDGSGPIGVFLTSALHPLLWAPLRPLAHQSIMGSFERVCVPRLADDAATTMMRSLGARQGIRFAEEAVRRIVTESQGVPLLLRRLGGSILELYDAERARQGSLGAVEIGVRGTEEALRREEREGSPLRVWIETEIAGPTTVPGALLRALASRDVVTIAELAAIAKASVGESFRQTGIANTLAPDEVARRTEEAAHVIVRMLEETGLVLPHGDLTAPDGYSLPDGVVRRVLSGQLLKAT